MAFDVSKLLLTADRQAQLTAALANATETVPLATICAEAEARVDDEIADLDVATELRDALVRAFALHQAYTLAEGPTPEDIQRLYDEALKLLDGLQAGADPVDSDSILGGQWGSETKIGIRA